ncbi:substrate-binding periplasmic protein [Deinococcus yavapaiensis]|nr:transporter substrate-binding domain-containing protein [Deinococcus yavapaiensis]
MLGVASYLLLRELPPDSSLALVQQSGVLNVCHPSTLAPFVDSDGDTVSGTEAELARRVAASIGVRVNWNLQPGWGQAPDPVDWGLRPESCDVLVGGIVTSSETQALMQLLPYDRVPWVLLTREGTPRNLGILANHWGLLGDQVFDWGDRHGYSYLSFESAGEAAKSAESGEVDAILALRPEAEQVAKTLPAWTARPVEDLPAAELNVGLWKTRITLKRAVKRAIEHQKSCCLDTGSRLRDPNGVEQ